MGSAGFEQTGKLSRYVSTRSLESQGLALSRKESDLRELSRRTWPSPAPVTFGS
jgi:hypothetical protein